MLLLLQWCWDHQIGHRAPMCCLAQHHLLAKVHRNPQALYRTSIITGCLSQSPTGLAPLVGFPEKQSPPEIFGNFDNFPTQLEK